MSGVVDISVLIPCLNEEATIASCIHQAAKAARKITKNYEIIIIDNASTDNTAKIAKAAGAKVVKEPNRGYGNAYKAGIRAAKGEYLFMGDGDGTYDFSLLPKYYFYAKKGFDFVIGNRFGGKMAKNAMPKLHRYFGNPFLSLMLRVLFNSPVKDSHCGMRLISKKSADDLELQAPGMEFASEMVIKASKQRLRIKQFTIPYYSRQAPSKLQSFRDGWRHVRFMLLFSPGAVFFIPGFFLFFLGIIILGTLASGPAQFGTLTLHTHPMFIGSLATIIGFQIIITGYFAKTFATQYFKEKNNLIDYIQKQLTLEKGLIFGGLLVIGGFVAGIIIFLKWLNGGLFALDEVRFGIIISTIIVVGIQIMFNAFYFISLQMSK